MEQLQQALLIALAGVVTAAGAYLAAWLRAKAANEKVQAIASTQYIVQDVVDRNVEAAEQIGKPKTEGQVPVLSGPQKKAMAEQGIKADLANLGRTVGKGILTAAAGAVASQIEGAVFRKLGGGASGTAIAAKLTKTF